MPEFFYDFICNLNKHFSAVSFLIKYVKERCWLLQMGTCFFHVSYFKLSQFFLFFY